MRVWSDRPALSHLAIFFAAYVLGCGFAQALAIIPETGISIWLPSGLFIATLCLAPRRSWPQWVLAGLLAELLGNLLWFHNPLLVAILIFAGNALEALVGAWLVTRFVRVTRLDSLQEMLGLIALGAAIAPVVGATVAGATLAWFGMQSFSTAFPLFWLGNASGVLIAAPLQLALFQDWRSGTRLSQPRWMEASAVGLALLSIAVFSLGDYLPFAYLIMPPLLWAAVRFEFRGAAASLALIAMIAAVFAISGKTQLAGDPGSQTLRQIMLYLFLAVSAVSAVIVAAISRQYQAALFALSERERELSQLVDMVPAYIRRLTPEGKPVFFNKRLTDFLGVSLEEINAIDGDRLEPAVKNYVHPDEATEVEAAIRRGVATGQAYSLKYRMRGIDGVYHWIETRAEPLHNPDGTIAQWYSVSIDIDEQVRLYRELEEREGKIRRLIDSDIIGIVFWDLDGRILEANDAFLRMIQYERKDLQAGLRWFDMTPSEWQKVHARDEAEELMATGKMQAREKEYFRKDGSRVPVLIGAACFEGQSTQGVAYILDLTERKRAEAALSERERFLWQVVETLPAMVDCAAPDGEPIYRNQRLREFLGYNLDALDGTGKSRLAGTLDAGVHPDDLEGVKTNYAHSLSTGEPYARRHRLRRFDGEYRWVETRAAPMYDAEGATVQWNVVCLDIDGEVQAQEKLRQAQERLSRASQAASLAELSASIAHEVNQPLAAIVANSHACHRWLMDTPPNLTRAKITAERIIRDANSAADVVSRIRALFKRSTGTRSGAELGSVVAEGLGLAADEIVRRGVRVSTDIESGLPLVSIDRVQILQVLVNLMRNGIEAMDATSDARLLGLRVHRAGDTIRAEISDSGPGIAFPEKIFEPFFTTKEHGMGMGLAVCRSIVEAHDGRLWAESNEPHGATFIFTLPAEAKVAA
ncbi:MASE1 domain-containing protein [Ensifer sp.]|jgi:PAS domain S-box-containing protein|uniref:MASE1 domain-containing protein n=1 Tax=Ensifer sp. TaxID=1872086 RepID=UPI002E1602F7|nr:MASE1 domain-containing protein [Ensifer sp.]